MESLIATASTKQGCHQQTKPNTMMLGFAGNMFHKRLPATANDLSPSRVLAHAQHM